ncbi:MAG: Creatininase [Deltaproteobacteria bacterium]|nr:Creatininase [Deltaproteobacteria bacterium]
MLNFFNTSEEMDSSPIDTAVLPMGSLEPKGPHLPAGFDLLLAHRFSKDFCAGKAVYLLPVFPFSTAMETRGFCGTVSLRQQTLWEILSDIASNLVRHGFKRLVFLDFSNYNWILKHAVRELNLNRESIQAVWVNPKEFAKAAAKTEMLPDYGGGAVETSLAFSLNRQWVHPPLEDFSPDRPREYLDYMGLEPVAPKGFWGKPTHAAAEIGDRLYNAMLKQTAEFVNYALGLFPGGRPIEGHQGKETWWPNGDMPGVEKGGADWKTPGRSISQSGLKLAVLPTSAIEQHSPCLPLATDYLQALEWGRRLAEELDAFLLPALPIVTSWGHIRFRGTLTFGAMTVRRLLEDIAESLYAGGCRTVVIVNNHGGNWVLKPTMIEINQKHGPFRIISTGDILSYRGQAIVEQLHASESEASFIRAFYPECFKADRVVDFSPQCPASAFDFVGIGGVSPHGVWGFPSKGTAEKGHRDLQRKVSEASAYVRRVMQDISGLSNR